jgi:hypothetical protein
MGTLLNERVVYGSLLFLAVMGLVFVSRPAAVFQDDHPRRFGLRGDATIYSLGVVTCVTAILAYFCFAYLDMVFGA